MRGLRLVWDVVPLLLPAVVLLTLLILDPAALAHLAWSSTTGAFGSFVQVTVSIFLLAGAGLAAWAFWPEQYTARRRRAPERGRARRGPRSDSALTGAVPKRRTRNAGAPGNTGESAAAPAVMVGAATAVETTAQPAPVVTTPAVAPAPKRTTAGRRRQARASMARADQPG